MASGKQTSQLGGWLLVFLIVCALFSVLGLFGLVAVATFWDPHDRLQPWHSTVAVWMIRALTITVIQFSLPLLIIWKMVFDRRWSSIRLVIILLWTFAFVSAIPMLFNGSLPMRFDIRREQGQMHFQIFVALHLIFAGLGTAYLLGSDRIRRIYRMPLDVAGVFD